MYRLSLLFFLSLHLAHPASAQNITARLISSANELASGDLVEVEVVLDMADNPAQLGAYKAQLNWNATALEVVGVLDGDTPELTHPQTRLEEGTLHFLAFNAAGAGGQISLLRVQFRAVEWSDAGLVLSFSELTAASTFANLLPELAVSPLSISIGSDALPAQPVEVQLVAPESVRGGDRVEVDVRVQMPTDFALGAVDLAVSWDEDVLSLVEVQEGDFAALQHSGEEGTLSLSAFNVDGKTGAFTLGKIIFRAGTESILTALALEVSALTAARSFVDLMGRTEAGSTMFLISAPERVAEPLAPGQKQRGHDIGESAIRHYTLSWPSSATRVRVRASANSGDVGLFLTSGDMPEIVLVENENQGSFKYQGGFGLKMDQVALGDEVLELTREEAEAKGWSWDGSWTVSVFGFKAATYDLVVEAFEDPSTLSPGQIQRGHDIGESAIRHYTLSWPSSATRVRVRASANSGDVGLFLTSGDMPEIVLVENENQGSFKYQGGFGLKMDQVALGDEVLELIREEAEAKGWSWDGSWTVSVFGFKAATYDLVVEALEAPATLSPGEKQRGHDIGESATRHYSITWPSSATRVRVRASATNGDVGLFLTSGGIPEIALVENENQGSFEYQGGFGLKMDQVALGDEVLELTREEAEAKGWSWDGSWTVTVFGFKAATYDLVVEALEAPVSPVDDRPFVVFGQTLEATLTTGRENRPSWFIDVPSRQMVAFEMYGDFDAYLRLYAEEATSHLASNRKRDGRRARIERILEAGIYRIEASAWRDQTTGPFQLVVSPELVGAAEFVEDGFYFEEGGRTLHGQVETAGEEGRRSYLLAVPTPGFVKLTLESGDFRPQVRLHYTVVPAGFPVDRTQIQSTRANVGVSEAGFQRYLRVGLYRVEACSYRDRETGSYALRVERGRIVRRKMVVDGLPEVASLLGAYPNPFNPSTMISYALSSAGVVHLEVYDVLGQRVRLLSAGYRDAGRHQVVWDGRDEEGMSVSTGMYLVRLNAGDYRSVEKISLLR